MSVQTYEDFFEKADVATYKRVKRGTMNLARVSREVIAGMVGGSLTQLDDSKKEYLDTRLGRYRLAMSHNSDNRTEMREHERLGATVIAIGDPGEMEAFFEAHGYAAGPGAVELMRAAIRHKLGEEDA